MIVTQWAKIMSVKRSTLVLVCATIFSSLAANVAIADLIYNPSHEKSLSDTGSVQSVRHSYEFNCDTSQLTLSVYGQKATELSKNGYVTGKITSKDMSQDISDDIMKALSTEDLLSRGITATCSPTSGAFILNFSAVAQHSMVGQKVTRLQIFPDGTVLGTRSRLSEPRIKKSE